jgi:hypothetical protein
MGGPAEGAATVWSPNLKVMFPPDAADHPILRIVDDPDRNREILERMPPFSGSNLTDRLKPAAIPLGLVDIGSAQVVMRVPVPQRRRHGAARNSNLMPILSCETFGRGRTFALSSDTTRDWGMDFEQSWGEGDNRYFRKFWRNVVEWLAENSTNSNQRLHVECDKLVYRPGQPIRIAATAFDEHREPTARYRLVARLTDAAHSATPRQRPVTLAPRGGTTLEGELTAPTRDDRPGAGNATSQQVTLNVAAYDHDRFVAQTDLALPVLDDSPEFRDPRPDHTKLATLARGSGGRVIRSAADLTAMLRSDHAQKGPTIVSRVPLWDTTPLWALLVGLLGLEWCIRRVKGLA